MPTFTRTEVDLIGTPASPATIGASASTSGTLDMTGSTVAEAAVGVAVIIGSSAPGTSPTVQFGYSLDGTNFVPDGGPFVVPITVTSTTYYYTYTPPDAAKKVQATVINGTTNAITAWSQGTTLGIS